MRNKSNYFRLVLIAVFLVGMALRIKSAMVNDLWVDEATGFFIGRESSLQDIFLGTADPPHNFLYTYLIRLVSWVNTSVFFLRLPSLFFGFLNILLVYLVSKKLINRNLGLICALLFSFSPYQIEYSWWARMYEMVLFFSLFSLFSLVSFKETKKPWWGWLFVLANLLGYWTDYSFVWYLLVMNLGCLFFRKKNPKLFTYVVLSDLLVVLGVPVLVNRLPTIYAYHISWIEKPNLMILQSTLLWLMGLRDFWDRNISNWWLIAVLLPVLLSAFLVKKRLSKVGLIYPFILSLVLPISISYWVSRLSYRSIFLGWNFISISTAVIFWEGLLIYLLLGEKRWFFRFFGATLLVLVLVLNFHLYYYRTSGIRLPRKEGWYYRKTAELLRSEYNPDSDRVMALGYGGLLRYYYQGYWENRYQAKPSLTYLGAGESLNNGNVWLVLAPWFYYSANEMEKLREYPPLEGIRFEGLTPYFKEMNVYKISIPYHDSER